MATIGQSCCQSHHRVVLATEGHLERLCLVYLCHEIAAFGLGYHPDGSALEGSDDLNTRIVPCRTLRIAETDTACILDQFVGRTDDASFDGCCFIGKSQLAAKGQHSDEMESFHFVYCLEFIV